MTGAEKVAPDGETDLALLAAVRERRRRLIDDLATGRLLLVETVAATESRFLLDTRLVKVLECCPVLGKVAGRRLLSELGLDERTTLGGASPESLRILAGRLDAGGATT